MTRAEKTATIEALKEKFKDVTFFYITDSSTLTVEEVNNFRRLCFEKGIEMRVVKNTLVKKAFDAISDERNFAELDEALKGPTAILFTDTANAPARVIKQFREDHEKPVLKAAYIDSDVFFGDDQIETLSKLKSKEELIAEVINLLESPAKSVIAALDSGGQTIVNLLTALEEREG